MLRHLHQATQPMPSPCCSLSGAVVLQQLGGQAAQGAEHGLQV